MILDRLSPIATDDRDKRSSHATTGTNKSQPMSQRAKDRLNPIPCCIETTTEGAIMLAVSVLTCFIASPIMGIIGLIEGITYLTKSDREFVDTYVNAKKGWF